MRCTRIAVAKAAERVIGFAWLRDMRDMEKLETRGCRGLPFVQLKRAR